MKRFRCRPRVRRTLKPCGFGMLLAATLPVLAADPPSGARFVMPPSVVTAPGQDGVRLDADGLFGNFYPGATASPHAAILLLGGSEGGLGVGSTRIAENLAASGFAVLQLAYFAAPGLPPNLEGLPLETFDRALAWLRRQPSVDAARIGIVGASKGAEAALLIAAAHPELRVVVAGVPSNVVWPGIDFDTTTPASSWTRDGKPLPMVPYGQGSGDDIAAIYRAGLSHLDQHRDALIPVERIRARVLLICGQADRLWPSCPMSDAIVATMNNAHAGPVVLLAYADAGHAVFGPPIEPTAPAYPTLGMLGGSPAGVDAARRDAWPRIEAFLHEALR